MDGKHLGEEKFNWMKAFGEGKIYGGKHMGRKDLIGWKAFGEENI